MQEKLLPAPYDAALPPSSPSKSDAEIGVNSGLLSHNSFSLLSFFISVRLSLYDRLMMINLLLNIFRYIPDCTIKFYRYVHSTAGS